MNELEGRCDDIDTLPLFDIEPVEVVKPEPMSADRRRTVRQSEMIANGGHPLHLAAPTVRRHPDTRGESYSRDDAKGRDLTCGSCVFRKSLGYHTASYPKCTVGEGARTSHGAGTDCKAWWPACTEWAPK